MRLDNPITSIAIGSFDGIHLAHKELISRVDAIVIIERNTSYLSVGYRRSFYTDKICCFYHFDKIKTLSPKEFVDRLKSDFPKLKKIVVGYDFHFGKDKSGDSTLLKSLTDIEVEIIEEVKYQNIPVHSATIKSYIKNGNLSMANALLGRDYSIVGRAIRGQGIGKKELFATINLVVEDYLLPIDGVYKTNTKIDNIWYKSISFLGHRKTTDNSFAIETHIIDKDIEYKDFMIEIEFVEFMRDNKKFDSLSELKKQISMDIDYAKN